MHHSSAKRFLWLTRWVNIDNEYFDVSQTFTVAKIFWNLPTGYYFWNLPTSYYFNYYFIWSNNADDLKSSCICYLLADQFNKRKQPALFSKHLDVFLKKKYIFQEHYYDKLQTKPKVLCWSEWLNFPLSNLFVHLGWALDEHLQACKGTVTNYADLN